jgi:hypothetical protein
VSLLNFTDFAKPVVGIEKGATFDREKKFAKFAAFDTSSSSNVDDEESSGDFKFMYVLVTTL